MIGADNNGGNRIHGLMDDFAVFSKQLTETDIKALATGTAPSALSAAAGLMAYWNFDDIPPQGIFLSFSPTPDTTGAAPNSIKVVHLQGSTPWDLTKVGLKLDGQTVTPTTSKAGSRVTVSYVPSPLLAIGSTHTATLTFPNPDGTTGTQEWSFTVAPYSLDTVQKYVGRFIGPTKFTADAGGHSGAAGDYAADLGKTQNGQGVVLGDPAPLNQASATDEMSVVGWQKLYSLASSAFFFGVSPGSNGGQRGFGAFPWGNNNIYFDTAGCCDGATQRINAAIDNTTVADYVDASWWTNWHHFVYQKKGSLKEVWIDGNLFLQGDSTAPLPTDFTEGYIGVDVPDNARLQGIIDDFAIFGTALDEANIDKLVAGAAPSTLPAATKLLAYWNFNDAGSTSTPAPTISVATAPVAGKVRITFTGTLESVNALGGSWAPVQSATSPWDVSVSDAKFRFYRAKN